MKKIVRNILAVAVMLGTYTSYGNQEVNALPISYNVNKNQIIKVTDAKGKVIFNAQMKDYNGDISKSFNFEQLKDGVYMVEITRAFEIEVKAIEVKDHNVTFIDSAKERIFKPVVRTEQSKVLISKLDLDAKEMTVELYFEDELIHTELIEGETILNRVYQLDRSQPGDYTAIIRANDRVYVEHFRI